MAAKTGGFSIVITAVNRATAPIDAINQSIASMRAPFERAGKSLSKFTDLSGVNALGRGLKSVAGTAVSVAASVTKIATPLAAITGAVSIAGVVALTERWAQFGQALRYSAIRSGDSVSHIHAVSGAIEAAGGSFESGAAAMTSLKDVLYDVKGGRNNEALLYLRDLHIATDGVAAGTETTASMFPKLAAALGRVKDSTARTRMEMVFFGGAYEDIDRLIQRGGGTLAEYTEIMRRHGIMTDAGADKADKTRMAWVGLKQSVEGLTNSLAERLAPSLQGVLGFFSDLIDRNRTKIVDNISDAFGRLVTWLEKIDWQHVAQYIGEMAGKLVDAAGSIGEIGKKGLLRWAGEHILGPQSEDEIRADYMRSAGRQESGYEAAGRVDTARHIVDRLVKDGETRPNAIGITAGLNRESGLDPKAMVVDTDGLVHRGLASWSPDRNQRFYKRTGKNLKDATLDEQIDFVHSELNNEESPAAARIRKETTPRGSAEAATEYYLRPANARRQGEFDGDNAERLGKLMGNVQVDVNIHGAGDATATAHATGAATAPAPRVHRTGVGQ